MFEQMTALMRKPAEHTAEPRMSRIARIDITLRFCRFFKDALPLFIAKGLTRHGHNVNRDALAYGNVPALAERLHIRASYR